MDEWTLLTIGVGVLIISVLCIAGYGIYEMGFSPIESHTGELIDVEFSQSGAGSPDIMVFYFRDGTVLRFSNPISDVHLGNCTVVYRGNDYMKYFVDIN